MFKEGAVKHHVLKMTVQILCLCTHREPLLQSFQQFCTYIIFLFAWKTTNREQLRAAHFLEYWGPCTVNASLGTSSEIVSLPRKLQQLWWNRIYPYMVDPLGLMQRNENGFQSNNKKDEDITSRLCKCNQEENFVQKFCVLCFGVIRSFFICSILTLQMDAALPENKWNTKMTSNICRSHADTQNKPQVTFLVRS